MRSIFLWRKAADLEKNSLHGGTEFPPPHYSRTPKSARLHRWQLILSEYEFTIEYIRGGLHKDVDCLSRAPQNEEIDEYLDDKVFVATNDTAAIKPNRGVSLTPIDPQEWKRATQADEKAQIHYAKARQRQKGYKIHQGCLYYENRLYAPKSIRQELIGHFHADEPSCHGGVRATLERMSHLWWPSMANDVRV